MEDVIQFILVVLLIYFGIKLIIRFFGPMILRYIMKRVGKNISRKFQDAQNSAQSQRREGEVSIDKKPKNKRKSNNEVGEYVDYEEID